MEGKKKNKRIFYLMLGISILLIGGMSATFAYFSASKSNTGTISGTTNNTNGILTINVARLSLNPSPEPSSDALIPAGFGVTPDNITTTLVNNALTAKCAKNGYTGCHVWKITASTTQTVSTANIRLSLTLPTVVDKNEWSYVVYTGSDSASSNIVYKGRIIESFPNDVTTLDIHNGQGLTANTAQVYYVMVYLNNVSSVQNDGVTEGTTNATGRYNGSVTLEAMGGEVRANFLEDAAQYITNLFNSDTTVINNSIEYQYDTTHNLMKDRLGGTTQSLDDGNIRYWGANPDNYVWFGETYTSACSADVCGTARAVGDKKLYRIIGVFDNKIKLIQNDSIGTYSWDTSATSVNSGRGINQWGPSPQDGSGYKGADLMKLLNPGYEDNEDLNNSGATITVNNSLYWNSGNGNCYKGANNATKACDFSSTGLSSSIRSKIEEVTWYLGGGGNISIYSDQAYIMERDQNIVTNPTDGIDRTVTWSGKVGLMYPSDYGYATDLRTCKSKLGAYSSALNSYACRVNDWIYNEKGQYVITPYVTYNFIPWRVTHTGYLGGGNGAYDADTVQPVFYLNPKVVFEKGGTGTEQNPYYIK